MRISPGGAEPRRIAGTTGEADVLAATATLDETTDQYLTVVAGLYGYDGATLSRLLAESSSNPNLRGSLYEGSTQIGQGDTPADGLTQPSSILDTLALPHLFNGSTWDRRRGTEDRTLLASATRSSSASSANQTNYNGLGLVLYINITARTVGGSPTIQLVLSAIDPVSSGADTYAYTGNFEPTLAQYRFVMYPGLSAAVTGTYQARTVFAGSLPLPRVWKADVNFIADVTNLTYSLGVSVL